MVQLAVVVHTGPKGWRVNWLVVLMVPLSVMCVFMSQSACKRAPSEAN